MLEIVAAVRSATAHVRHRRRSAISHAARPTRWRIEEVVYPGPSPNGQGFAKYVLGPVVISGQDFDSAGAVIDPQTGQWTVEFDLNGDGAKRFAEATTARPSAPPRTPTNQIAIIVDRVVISSPGVNEPPSPAGSA